MEKTTKKILVIAPSWVGDAVMAQVLFFLLKKNNPDCQIDILAPEWTFPIFSRMPEIYECLVSPFSHGKIAFLARVRLAKEIRMRAYDQAIVLPNSWKSAFIPWMARIPLRTGWLGECRFGLLNDYRKLNKQRYPRMIDRFAALAFSEHALLPELPFPKLTIHREELKQTLAKLGLSIPQEKKILALCPGAEFGNAKRWPPDYFAQLAQLAIQEGWEVWLFGSAKEKSIGDVVMQHADCKNLIGKTSLTQCIDLLSVAQVVVSNDSGLMHIAAAFQKPLIALYGPTSPDFTPPLSPQAMILQTHLNCQPCFARECPLKHHHCMRKLLPNQVFEKVKSYHLKPDEWKIN